MLCQVTQFSILPMAGGMLDQNPGFLSALEYILVEQQKYDKAKEKKDKNATMGPGRNQPRPKRVAGH